MVDTVLPLPAPNGVDQARRRMFGSDRGARRAPVQPFVAVSDAQIVALVAAADALGRRQRQGHREAAVPSPEADERLLRLDWAVRAGRLVLAERAAARAPTLPERPAAGTAERLRVDL